MYKPKACINILFFKCKKSGFPLSLTLKLFQVASPIIFSFYLGFPKETPELKFGLRFFFPFSHSLQLSP